MNVALLRMIQECREKEIWFHYAILENVFEIDSSDMETWYIISFKIKLRRVAGKDRNGNLRS